MGIRPDRLGAAMIAVAMAACVSQQFKSSNTLIDNADAAFARGDYEAAERDYQQAAWRAEGAGGYWAKTEGERGLGKVAIMRVRQKAPAVAAQTSPHDVVISELHALRKQVREAGGDPAADAELVLLVQGRARAWMDEADARAARGELVGAANHVRALLSVRDAPPEVIARAQALRTKAADASRARAAAAGDAHPLLRRLHLGIAASFSAGTAPSATELLAPFQRGVDVTVKAPADCSMGALDALRAPGTNRRIALAIEVTSCTATTDAKDSTETVKWVDQVSDGMETYYVMENQCREVCGEVLTGSEKCSTNYNTNPPSLLCEKQTRTVCTPMCSDVKVAKQREKFHDEPRSAERKITTQTSGLAFAASWTLTRDGATTRDTVRASQSSRLVTAPKTGKVEARSDGSYASPDELVARQAKELHGKLAGVLAQVHARDVEAARVAARALAGKTDDEEEAWLRQIALGGDDAGPLAARYAADRPALYAYLTGTRYGGAEPAPELPAAKVFAEVARGQSNLITKDDLSVLELTAPITFARGYAIQVETAYLSLPIVHDMAKNRDVSGDSGFVVGVRGAASLLDRKHSKWGWRLADEGTMSIALGGRTGGPELMDVPLGDFAATFAASYAIGAGYRKPGVGAVVGGVRASYKAFLVGATSGSYRALPLFVRAEAPTIYGTIAAEVLGASLLGSSQWGLTLSYTKARKRGDDWATYFQFRVERTSVSPSITDFDDPMTTDGTSAIDDLDLTAVYFLIGKGR